MEIRILKAVKRNMTPHLSKSTSLNCLEDVLTPNAWPGVVLLPSHLQPSPTLSKDRVQPMHPWRLRNHFVSAKHLLASSRFNQCQNLKPQKIYSKNIWSKQVETFVIFGPFFGPHLCHWHSHCLRTNHQHDDHWFHSPHIHRSECLDQKRIV